MSESSNEHSGGKSAAKVAAFATTIAVVGVGAKKARDFAVSKRAERKARKAAHLTAEA